MQSKLLRIHPRAGPLHSTLGLVGQSAAAKQCRRRAASERSSDFRILLSFVTSHVASLTGGKIYLKLRGINTWLVPPNSEAEGDQSPPIPMVVAPMLNITKLMLHPSNLDSGAAPE